MRQRARQHAAMHAMLLPGNPDSLLLMLGGPVVPLVFSFIRRDNLLVWRRAWREFTCLNFAFDFGRIPPL